MFARLLRKHAKGTSPAASSTFFALLELGTILGAYLGIGYLFLFLFQAFTAVRKESRVAAARTGGGERSGSQQEVHTQGRGKRAPIHASTHPRAPHRPSLPFGGAETNDDPTMIHKGRTDAVKLNSNADYLK